MITKVLEYIKKYRMIEPGDIVTAGVSGGADSVCLLFVLLEISKQIPFQLEVVHVNHGIRREAGRDADFVKELCRKLELPFHLVEEDVRKKAALSGLSEEEEGRLVRYQAFEEILGTRKGRIAVAHNSNDRAETMLFHLFRGTGLRGMGGIPPVNGRIIRPLLCLERDEIEAWLAERGYDFCEDITNQQDRYTRNRIRHHILSYARQEICSSTVPNMNRTAEQLLEAEQFIQRSIAKAMERCVERQENGNTILIRLPEFDKEDGYLKDRLLLECVGLAAGSRKDITAVHIESIRSVFSREGNGRISLPYGLVARKQYDTGVLEKEQEQKRGFPHFQVNVPGLLTVPELGTVEFTVFGQENYQNIPEKRYTKWFDYDKITSILLFRTRMQGDFLTINKEMGRKSLQDYLVNEKVPRQERDSLYLLADGSHVLWIPGHRISEYYKVNEDTRRILKVEIRFFE